MKRLSKTIALLIAPLFFCMVLLLTSCELNEDGEILGDIASQVDSANETDEENTKTQEPD